VTQAGGNGLQSDIVSNSQLKGGARSKKN